VLFSKNTATATSSVKKHSGGPDRNNHILMEFHLNKVSSISLPASQPLFVTQLSCPLTAVTCGESLRDISNNGCYCM